ncbi:hypothetical protein [Streptomyces sp. NPDC048606]|uniref:hypothetical protein n=1 Tax=Streptomyces sp. NPDC048606 TaxID=3154726 RepID=UPI00341E579B
MVEHRVTPSFHLGFSPVPVAATTRPALLCQPCSRVSTVRRAAAHQSVAQAKRTRS